METGQPNRSRPRADSAECKLPGLSAGSSGPLVLRVEMSRQHQRVKHTWRSVCVPWFKMRSSGTVQRGGSQAEGSPLAGL